MSPHERWLVRAVLAWALFIIYGSLVPLQWQPQPLGAAWQTFIGLPLPVLGGSAGVDAAVNYLLTVPLAFGLAMLLARASDGAQGSRAQAALGLAVTAVVMASLSVGIEFAQVFFPPRSPSWSDVIAQWCGTLTGLVLYLVYGRRASAILQGLGRRQSGEHAAARWLMVWLAGLLLFNMMPLDLSLLPVELYRKWRDGRVLLWPFSADAASRWELVYGWVSDVLLWMPVGALWRIDGRDRSLRQIVLLGLLVALAMELAQLFVMSRVSDVTDIFLAGLGVLLGGALVGPLQAALSVSPTRRRRWLYGAAVAWSLVAVALLWLPFDFRASRFSVAALSDVFFRMPFVTYMGRSEFGALNEILRKLLVFLPGGLLLGAASAGPGAPPRWPFLTLVAFAFVLEAGQLALPDKVPDLTDALLACLGAWLGLRIARLITALELPSEGLSPEAVAPQGGVAPRPTLAPAGGLTQAQGLAWSLGSVLLLALLVWTLGRLPGLPYNLPKLMPAGPQGVVAALALALALWWMLAAPLLVLWPSRHAWRLGLPLLAVAHGLISFLLLRASVPLPMLHKIVGSPVLGWGGWWEDMGRFLALHLSVMLPLLGAMFLVHALWRPAGLAALIGWLFAALLMFWPLHTVVVVWAGTDNLVELMRGGGSFLSSLALAGALGWAAAAGGALALGLAQRTRRSGLAVLGLIGLILAPWLAWIGLEHQVEKYGQSFSALQFLLSASRAQYAPGPELAMLAAAAGAGFLFCMAALQFPLWRSLAGQTPAHQGTPALGSGRRRPA